MEKKAADSLARLLPRLKAYCTNIDADWSILLPRIEDNFDQVFHYLFLLYGERYDFFFFF